MVKIDSSSISREIKEEGRWLIGWSKFASKIRCVIESGRLSTDWFPKMNEIHRGNEEGNAMLYYLIRF